MNANPELPETDNEEFPVDDSPQDNDAPLEPDVPGDGEADDDDDPDAAADAPDPDSAEG